MNNALAGETHSILFEVSEGSSNPLTPIATIDWYYMKSNTWLNIKVEDQTNQLSQSGLVIFHMPGDETTNNTRAENGLLWLKAVVTSNTDALCRIISINSNAAKVAFVQDIVNNLEFTENIPSNIISKPAIADGAIKQISQPYGSFRGTPKENNMQFNLRVCERLRHKQRAVTVWDYERLVLQNFPQIHKVKCIAHTALSNIKQKYSELKPGSVMLVTIPDISKLTGANPLLPFTNIGLLTDIENYLKNFTSPFVELNVCNPQLEGVRFEFDVTFNNNSNINFYKTKLDNDIVSYLMPWAFGSTATDIEFGGKIKKSVVLSFVQNLPYVDFVTCFKMSQWVYQADINSFVLLNNDSDIEEAIASTARSILVPYSETGVTSNNKITSPANCNCNG